MDSRQRADLDNYITGHGGEDQFRGECECDLPIEPDDGEEVACEDCGTVWRYNEGDGEWESVGQVEED